MIWESGPFLWPPGVMKPGPNRWRWNKLTNVVWVDQPIGTGYSQGPVTARDQHDTTRQFMGFWKNFVDTFAMQGYKIYITGSSYSGIHCPYVASGMLDANDPVYYNVDGMLVWDGMYSQYEISQDIPVASFVDSWSRVFSFNESFTEKLHTKAQECGYTDYLKKWLSFPPAGVQPKDLPGQYPNGTMFPECDHFGLVYNAARVLNPCFSAYEIFRGCPLAHDVNGFTDAYRYFPKDAGTVYFNRTDVKAAINAPDVNWNICSRKDVFVNGTDLSIRAGPGSQPVIPGVIDRTQNVIIGHGLQDYVCIADGTLLAIQNMTWGGKLGFQSRPSTPLVLPSYPNRDFATMAGGSGTLGVVHSERGLTYLEVATAGHMMGADEPALSFRAMQILLGRVDGFHSQEPFNL
jgi:carboxypeptidase D